MKGLEEHMYDTLPPERRKKRTFVETIAQLIYGVAVGVGVHEYLRISHFVGNHSASNCQLHHLLVTQNEEMGRKPRQSAL